LSFILGSALGAILSLILIDIFNGSSDDSSDDKKKAHHDLLM